MDSKRYGAYAKNKNNKLDNDRSINKYNHDDVFYDIHDLVVANILTCKRNENGVTFVSSPKKYIFVKSNVNGIDMYRVPFDNTEINSISNPFVDFDNIDRCISNIEDLTDYIDVVTYKSNSPDLSLNMDDLIDMQESVNVINQEEEKQKKRA